MIYNKLLSHHIIPLFTSGQQNETILIKIIWCVSYAYVTTYIILS